MSRRNNIAAIQPTDSTDEMQLSHLFPGSSGAPLPERFLSRLVGFADLFTCPTWSNVLLLLAGAVLAPRRHRREVVSGRPWTMRPSFSPFLNQSERLHCSPAACSRHCSRSPDGGRVGTRSPFPWITTRLHGKMRCALMPPIERRGLGREDTRSAGGPK